VSTLLHATIYVVLHNLVNVLVQIANKMDYKKNVLLLLFRCRLGPQIAAPCRVIVEYHVYLCGPDGSITNSLSRTRFLAVSRGNVMSAVTVYVSCIYIPVRLNTVMKQVSVCISRHKPVM
jgi:hypothetical protein